MSHQAQTPGAGEDNDLYRKLMALRLQAAEFADEAADNRPLNRPVSEYEASERGKAGAYYEAAQLVKAALAAQPEKQGGAPAGWQSMSERPKPLHKIIAPYSDGSGAVMLWFDGDSTINSDGDERGWPQSGLECWTYLPDGFKLWCEHGDEDGITFPTPPPRRRSDPARRGGCRRGE